jgi:plastocyanin
VIAALALTAALVAPSTHTVQAVSTATDNVWSPAALNAQPGDTIQWNLDTPDRPTAHDVWLTAPGAAERPLGKGTMLGGTGTASEVLNDVGSYEFVCKIHAASMRGSITVTVEEAPPPPPPVDTGPAALPNPTTAPTVFEEGDNVRPTLTVTRMTAGRSAQVRITTSEAGTLYLRVLRGSRALTTRRVKVSAGAASASVRLPRRAGRYRLAVWVRDAAGLESKWRYRTLRVRS